MKNRYPLVILSMAVFIVSFLISFIACEEYITTTESNYCGNELKSRPAPPPGGNCCSNSTCGISYINCGPLKCDNPDSWVGWMCQFPQTFSCRGDGNPYHYCSHQCLGCIGIGCRCIFAYCYCGISNPFNKEI